MNADTCIIFSDAKVMALFLAVLNHSASWRRRVSEGERRKRVDEGGLRRKRNEALKAEKSGRDG